jgi:inosose dehydratase
MNTPRNNQTRNRIGIGPIGWVNDDIRGWGPGFTGDEVMRDMAELGYEGSEMSYTYPQEPGELKAKLALYGLELAGAYRWTNFIHEDLFDEELEEAKRHVDFCKAAGARFANVAEGGGSLHWDRKGQQESVTPLSDDQWERLTYALHEVGRYARAQGVVLSVHPHGGTPIETPDDIDRLFKSTDPVLVGYCLDTGHIAYGRGDPAAVTERWAKRVTYVHLKDVRPEVLERVHHDRVRFVDAVKANVFCTPGAGSIDFDPVIAALQEVGYHGWHIVEAEQDPSLHDPREVSGRARAFLKERYGL